MKVINRSIARFIAKVAARKGLTVTIGKLNTRGISKVCIKDFSVKAKHHTSPSFTSKEFLFGVSIWNSLLSFSLCGKVKLESFGINAAFISEKTFTGTSLEVEYKLGCRKKSVYLVVDQIPMYCKATRKKNILELYFKILQISWDGYAKVMHDHIHEFLKSFSSADSTSFQLYYRQEKNKVPYFTAKFDAANPLLNLRDSSTGSSNRPIVDKAFLQDLAMERRKSLAADSYLALGKIPRFVVNAIISTEDPDFWNHSGISPLFVGYAIRENLKHRKFIRGASTITMQLVRNIFLSHDKSLIRKIEECIIAYLLENYYKIDKKTLLELYLNIIEFAPDTYGLAEACKLYFGKHPSDLSLQEALILTYIIPRPKHFYDALIEKTEQLKKNLGNHITAYANVMYHKGLVQKEEVQNIKEEIHFTNQLGTLKVSLACLANNQV